MEIRGDKIYLAGKETQILSGAMHYFRIHPDYWQDRLDKLRQCGLNTVETYLAWNIHEPRENEFDFSAGKDFVKFIKLAADTGLHVMVRPGPYICSEWDLGGLPAWLLVKPGLRLRCMNSQYLTAAGRYMDKVLQLLSPLQDTCGGPIIAMQIENEYGSYGTDIDYLKFLQDCFVRAKINVPLFTANGNTDFHMYGGALPNVLSTIDFRNHPSEKLAYLDSHRPGWPKFAMELWCGGAHHWGEMYPWHDQEAVRVDIHDILQNKYHMNIYMFHGGSNWGFMNGANYHKSYQAMLSTYDVDAPVSEEGDCTPKYFVIQEEIKKYYPEREVSIPKVIPKQSFGMIELPELLTLRQSLGQISQAIKVVAPETMENYGQYYGYILYQTRVSFPGMFNLLLDDLQDRAVVMIDGQIAGVIYRNDVEQSCLISVPEGGVELSILVENMGRVNYGPTMEKELKGITGARIVNQFIFHWDVYCLPLDNLDALDWSAGTDKSQSTDSEYNIIVNYSQPLFAKGIVKIDQPADTFLRVHGGTKGNIFVNNFNLGRYWKIGPQQTVHVPAPLLKPGDNTIIVFEQQGFNPQNPLRVESTDCRDFGQRFKMQI